MNNHFAILSSAVLSLLPFNAAAQDMIHLEPTGDWVLEYAEESCRLSRAFGEGEQETLLGITAYEPRGLVFLSAVGELARIAHHPDTVTIALDEVEELELPIAQAEFEGTPTLLATWAITFGPLPEGVEIREMRRGRAVERWSRPDIEEQVHRIGFIDGLEQEFVLETGSMRPPLAALEECARELTDHWDIDQQAKDSLSRFAHAANQQYHWLRIDDFPRGMRQRMAIRYRLIVDVNGDVDGCHIMGTEPDSDIHQIACEHISQRARLHPAEDAAGNPVRSYYVNWADLR